VPVKILINRLHAAIPLQVKYRQPLDQPTFLLIRNPVNIIGFLHLMPKLAIDFGQLGKDR
jgi:hypothetical protein